MKFKEKMYSGFWENFENVSGFYVKYPQNSKFLINTDTGQLDLSGDLILNFQLKSF